MVDDERGSNINDGNLGMICIKKISVDAINNISIIPKNSQDHKVNYIGNASVISQYFNVSNFISYLLIKVQLAMKNLDTFIIRKGNHSTFSLGIVYEVSSISQFSLNITKHFHLPNTLCSL